MNKAVINTLVKSFYDKCKFYFIDGNVCWLLIYSLWISNITNVACSGKNGSGPFKFPLSIGTIWNFVNRGRQRHVAGKGGLLAGSRCLCAGFRTVNYFSKLCLLIRHTLLLKHPTPAVNGRKYHPVTSIFPWQFSPGKFCRRAPPVRPWTAFASTLEDRWWTSSKESSSSKFCRHRTTKLLCHPVSLNHVPSLEEWVPFLWVLQLSLGGCGCSLMCYSCTL